MVYGDGALERMFMELLGNPLPPDRWIRLRNPDPSKRKAIFKNPEQEKSLTKEAKIDRRIPAGTKTGGDKVKKRHPQGAITMKVGGAEVSLRGGMKSVMRIYNVLKPMAAAMKAEEKGRKERKAQAKAAPIVGSTFRHSPNDTVNERELPDFSRSY